MSIGSAPEIGATFTTIHGFDFAAWRAAVGPDLLGGYGTLCHPPRGSANPYTEDTP